MKRFFLLFLLLALLPRAPAYAEPLRDGDLKIAADHAVLMESKTGELLYEKAAHERVLPASVTKVMTLLLIVEDIESGRLKTDDVVTASERAASFGGSCVYLEEGERMSVDEMLKCIAVVSANDCAVALGEHLCGSEEAFTARMNARAAELGMEDTHFTNCTGLFEDPKHYTSAHDIALMSRELLGHDFIRPFTAIWTDTIRNGSFGLTNTNKLVRFYPGCTGLKTGFTSKAMFCLSASACRDDVEYIAVILHGETSQRRFDDARTLLDYAFANYTLVRPALDEAVFVPVDLGAEDRVEVTLGGSGAAVVRKSAVSALSSELTLPESVAAPIDPGQELGKLTLRAGDEIVAEVPLLSSVGVERIRLWPVYKMLVRTLCGQ